MNTSERRDERATGPPIPCHVLPHERADGATNMARDEALLDAVAADPGAAFLRTYEWSAPTLSLGYFQAIAAAEADPRWRDAPVVRRATGGGALWHDREVTYAVVVPAHHPLARPSSALYAAIHRAIAERLRGIGLAARRFADAAPGGREAAEVADPQAKRPFLCFADRDRQDVVVAGAKLVGSAQRRRAGAVLQHGSLLLARSPATPELPGLREVGGGRLDAADDPAAWAATLREDLAWAIGGPARAGNWADSTLDRADILRKTIYGDTGWTRRR